MSQNETIETPQDYVNYTFNIEARGIAEVSSDLMGLSNTVGNILGQLAFKTSEFLTHTEALAMGAGAAISALYVSATQDAIHFQQQIANVKAIGGESVNAASIGDAAMEYSNKFGMATASMTEGLEALARAGITTTDVMKQVLEEGVKLSKLEGMDLEDSINDLISTTNLLSVNDVNMNDAQYAEMVKQMNQHIVSTSESAPINAQNIIQSLQHVGGYASASGMDQDDLFAVIAQLGARGTKGEMAGTALRAFIAAGQKDTAQRALSRIGLNVKDLWNSDGETMLSISEMKDVLDQAMEKRGYSKQEKLEFYSDFAGYKQANQIMKINTSEVQQYKDQIANAWDLGKKLDTILGTVRGNLDRIWQITQNFMTKVGSKLLTIMGAILTPVRMFLELFTKIPFADSVVAIGMIYAGFRTGLMIFNKLVPAVTGFMSGLDKVKNHSRGIRGEWQKTGEEIQKAKHILDLLKNGDQQALAKIHYDTHGLSAKNKEAAKRDVAAQMYVGSDLYEETNQTPFFKLPRYTQDMFLERIQTTDEFQQNYETLVTRTKAMIDNAVSEPIIIEAFEGTDTLKSINEWVRLIYDLLQTDEENNDSHQGSSQSGTNDNRRRNAQARTLSNIFTGRVQGNTYGNVNFKYDRTEEGYEQAKAGLKEAYKDLRAYTRALSNTDLEDINAKQRNAYKKLFTKTVSERGREATKMANESEIRLVLEKGELESHEHSYEGIKDSQVQYIARKLGLDEFKFHDYKNNDRRAEFAQAAHQALQSKPENIRNRMIDEIINGSGDTLGTRGTNKLWEESLEEMAVGRRKFLENNSTLTDKIISQIPNIDTQNYDNDAEAILNYFDGLDDTHNDWNIAIRTAMEVLKNGSDFSQVEQNTIKYIADNIQRHKNTILSYQTDADSLNLSNSIRDEISDIIEDMRQDEELLNIGGERLGESIVSGFVGQGLGRHSPGYSAQAMKAETIDINDNILSSISVISKSAFLLGDSIGDAYINGLNPKIRTQDTGITLVKGTSDIIQDILADFDPYEYYESSYDPFHPDEYDDTHYYGQVYNQNSPTSRQAAISYDYAAWAGFDLSNWERFGKLNTPDTPNFKTAGTFIQDELDFYEDISSHILPYIDHDDIYDMEAEFYDAQHDNYISNFNDIPFFFDSGGYDDIIIKAATEAYYKYLKNMSFVMNDLIKNNEMYDDVLTYRSGRSPVNREGVGEFTGITATSFTPKMLDAYENGLGNSTNRSRMRIFNPMGTKGIGLSEDWLGDNINLSSINSERAKLLFNNQKEVVIGSGQPVIEVARGNLPKEDFPVETDLDLLALTPEQSGQMQAAVIDELEDISATARSHSDILTQTGIELGHKLAQTGFIERGLGRHSPGIMVAALMAEGYDMHDAIKEVEKILTKDGVELGENFAQSVIQEIEQLTDTIRNLFVNQKDELVNKANTPIGYIRGLGQKAVQKGHQNALGDIVADGNISYETLLAIMAGKYGQDVVKNYQPDGMLGDIPAYSEKTLSQARIQTFNEDSESFIRYLANQYEISSAKKYRTEINKKTKNMPEYAWKDYNEYINKDKIGLSAKDLLALDPNGQGIFGVSYDNLWLEKVRTAYPEMFNGDYHDSTTMMHALLGTDAENQKIFEISKENLTKFLLGTLPPEAGANAVQASAGAANWKQFQGSLKDAIDSRFEYVNKGYDEDFNGPISFTLLSDLYNQTVDDSHTLSINNSIESIIKIRDAILKVFEKDKERFKQLNEEYEYAEKIIGGISIPNFNNIADIDAIDMYRRTWMEIFFNYEGNDVLRSINAYTNPDDWLASIGNTDNLPFDLNDDTTVLEAANMLALKMLYGSAGTPINIINKRAGHLNTDTDTNIGFLTGITSTAYTDSMAEDYMTDDSYMIEIYTPAGTKGFNFDDRNEFTLPPNTPYIELSRDEENKQAKILLLTEEQMAAMGLSRTTSEDNFVISSNVPLLKQLFDPQKVDKEYQPKNYEEYSISRIQDYIKHRAFTSVSNNKRDEYGDDRGDLSDIDLIHSIFLNASFIDNPMNDFLRGNLDNISLSDLDSESLFGSNIHLHEDTLKELGINTIEELSNYVIESLKNRDILESNNILYRQGRLDTDNNNIGVFKGFTSTAYEESTADTYATDDRYAMKIFAPKGIQGTGKFDDEFILNHNTPFIELSRDDENKTAEILLLTPELAEYLGISQDIFNDELSNNQTDWLSYVKPAPGHFGMKELGRITQEGKEDETFMSFLNITLPETIQNAMKDTGFIYNHEIDEIIKSFIPDIKYAEEYDAIRRYGTQGLIDNGRTFYDPNYNPDNFALPGFNSSYFDFVNQSLRNQEEAIEAEKERIENEFNQAVEDLFTMVQPIATSEQYKQSQENFKQAIEDLFFIAGNISQNEEYKKSREEFAKAVEDLFTMGQAVTPEQTKKGESFGHRIKDFFSNKKTAIFDKLSNFNDKYYDEEKKERVSGVLSQTRNTIESILEPMRQFNDGLERAATVFPPLTILTSALNMAIGIGEGIVWALGIAESMLNVSRNIGAFVDLGLITAEQGLIISRTIQIAVTNALNAALVAMEFLITGPVLAAIAIVIAAILAVKFWEEQHAKSLKESQKALEESTAKNNIALSQYQDLKKARESETDAIKRQQAARKEAIALYELEASRINKRRAVHDESKLRNDAVWGEYGLRATLQKMGLGIIAGGDFESRYENYEGTTKNIRRVKEDTLGNLGATKEQQYVAAFYDANQTAFAEIDAYKDDLGKLYDVESKLIEKYGSIEDARDSQEFADAVQEFCDATGIQAETAVKYLDWLETENKVNQASKVAEANVKMVRARADAKAAGIDMDNGGFDSENMDDVGRAMVYAQVDQMIKDEKHEMWWTMLWEYLQAIISCLFLNFGEASKHTQKALAYQEGVAELEANREQYYQEAMDYYENADRYDYGQGSYSIHADTPFGGAISSAAIQHVEREQQKQYEATGQVMSENDYVAAQTQYQEDTFGITEEGVKQQKQKEIQEAQQKQKEKANKKADTTLGQLQNNGEQAHRDALDIIDAIKGKGTAGIVSGLGAGVMSLFDEDNPLFKSLRKKGLRDTFDFMAGEEGTVTEKVVSKGKNIYNEAKAAYGKNGLKGVYDYGKQRIKKLGNQGIDFLETKGINVRPYAEKGLDLFRQSKNGVKGLYQSAKAGYAENGVRGALSNIRNTAKSAIYGEAPGMMIMDDGTRVPLGGGKEGLLAKGQRGIKNIANEGRSLYQSTKAAYAEGGIGNVLSKGKDAFKSTSVGGKIADRIGLAREVNGLAADDIPVARSGIDKAVGVFDGAKAAYAEDGIRGVAKFGKEAGKSGVKSLASDTSGILSKGAEGLKNSYKPGAALGEAASVFNPKNLAGGIGDIAKGLKGGGTLLKGIGRIGGPALMALGPALAFADKASELNPFDGPHYNEDGSEKKALQATGEVVGTTAGAVGGVVGGLEGAAAGAAIGTAILPGIGTAIGAVAGGIAGGWLGDTIFQPIGEAIGGTIGWLGDNLLGGIQDVAGTVWDGLTGAASGVWNAVSGAASGVWDFLTGGGKGDQPIGGLLGFTPIGMGINAAAGIWDWLSGGNGEKDPYKNVQNQGKEKTKEGQAAKSENTIIIKNININTEDDPEKIKSALMNLIIEMQEQINPRQVSRTVGEPPAQSTSNTQNTNDTTQAQGTDQQSGTPNGNSSTIAGSNANTNPSR